VRPEGLGTLKRRIRIKEKIRITGGNREIKEFRNVRRK
jgi:hypothetical protein